ncbi:hypothetical protein AB0B48_19170 [Micromonospora sp. NPDC049089]|uniref:hypothetical protein n=1 Tax=unclassified Micromonospora TaxID=2617518 RepID=UPI0033D2470C
MSLAILVARERLLGLLPGRADRVAVHRSPRRDLLAGLTVAGAGRAAAPLRQYLPRS